MWPDGSRFVSGKTGAQERVTVTKTDMAEEMLDKLKTIVGEVFDKAKEKVTGNKDVIYKDIATGIKQAFDTAYPAQDNKATSGVYHCIVGTNFACSVTHETHFSCFMSCDNVQILLYKSKDSPFD